MGQSLEAKVKLTLVDKVTKKLNNINKAINNISNQNFQRGSLISVLPEKIQRTVKEAQRLRSEFKKNNALISDMGSKLKAVAATYLGIMGGRVVMDTSDIITGTKSAHWLPRCLKTYVCMVVIGNYGFLNIFSTYLYIGKP